MIEDKYFLLDELVMSNEKGLHIVIDCCNHLCDPEIRLKKLAE